MNRLVPAIAGIAALALAQSAFAMDARTWDFRGSTPQGLAPHNLTTVQPTGEGLYIETDTDGFLELPALTAPADVLVLTVTNIESPAAALIWRTPALGENEYYQQNVTLPSGQSREVTVQLNEIAEWEWSAPTLALAFPAGTQVLLETMEWRSYSATEKLWNGFVSFWTPDTFSLYSINFLWGPLVSTTPEGRAALFEAMPPTAWSATRIFYGAFALAAVVAGAWWIAHREGGRRRFLFVLAVAGAALWIVFDMRMTQEIAGYVAHDWKTYVLRDDDARELRTHRRLYDTLEDIDELLGDDGSYVLVENDKAPYFANARYKLYPAVPVEPERPGDATAWIVLGRPDVRFETGALVTDDGTVLSPKGAIVREFGDYSFFYRSTQ